MRSSERGVFVGRGAELARLGRMLTEPGTSTSWALVTGEPGIGKTRLLAEVAADARAAGMTVLSARGPGFERSRPFGVATDALEGHLAGLSPARRTALLRDLDPELTQALGPGPPAATPVLSVGAVHGLLEAIAPPAGLVAILDDLQWVDPESLSLAAELRRRPLRVPLVLLAAVRSGQIGPVDELWDERDTPGGTVLTLGPLTEQESAPLLAPLPGARRRAQVLRESGGNPLYLTALVRAQASRRAMDPVAAVPRAVALSIRAEVRALSASARGVADAAAVLGETFDIDMARAVAAMPEGEVLQAIDELTGCGLVRALAVPWRFTFRRPVVRSAIYESIRPGSRLAAHRRAAVALASRPAPQRAHHVARSVPLRDEEKVATLTEAADQVLQSAPGDAAEWLLAALHLIPQDAGSNPRRQGLLERFAVAAIGAGRINCARRALQEAIRLGADESGPHRARLVARLADVERLAGARGTAHARLGTELATIPDRGVEATALHLAAALDARRRLAYGVMRERAELAIRSGETGGDPAGAAAGHVLAGWAQLSGGDVAGARASRAAADELVAGLPDGGTAAQPNLALQLGRLEILLGDYEAALGRIRRAAEDAVELGRVQQSAASRMLMARGLAAVGRVADAVEWSAEAVEAAEAGGSPGLLVRALATRGLILTVRGEPSQANRCLDTAHALAASVSDDVAMAAIERRRAAALLQGGDAVGCRAAMARAGAPGLPLVEIAHRCLWFEMMVRAELAAGRPAEARTWVERAEAVARTLGLPVSVGLARTARARLLLAEGRPAEALVTAGEAARTILVTGARVQSGPAAILTGQALAQLGRREEAVEELRATADLLRTWGAGGLEQWARAELRRHERTRSSVRAPVAGAHDVSALSERERQVADLVAAGRTNREIAGTLFLSTKTIEAHLSRIFTKLSISSRASLAAAVERARPQAGADRVSSVQGL